MVKNTIDYKKQNPQTLQEAFHFRVYPLSHWGSICNLFSVVSESLPWLCTRGKNSLLLKNAWKQMAVAGRQLCKWGLQRWDWGQGPHIVITMEMVTAQTSCAQCLLCAQAPFWAHIVSGPTTTTTTMSPSTELPPSSFCLFHGKQSWIGDQGSEEWVTFRAVKKRPHDH
jgi:hypothetical protein